MSISSRVPRGEVAVDTLRGPCGSVYKGRTGVTGACHVIGPADLAGAVQTPALSTPSMLPAPLALLAFLVLWIGRARRRGFRGARGIWTTFRSTGM